MQIFLHYIGVHDPRRAPMLMDFKPDPYYVSCVSAAYVFYSLVLEVSFGGK
jgi:hypothetical protein